MLKLNQPKRINPNAAPRVKSISPQAAQIAAHQLLQSGFTDNMRAVLRLLLSAGALPEYHFPVGSRTLYDYHARRLLDRLPYVSAEIRAALVSHGLPVPENAERSLVYTLGPVGAELVREIFGVAPASGYLGAPLERVMHDLATNEIVLRINESAAKAGWALTWQSKYEGTLWKDDVPILEPDALIRFQKGGREQTYLIEYHNEDKRTRATSKVRKYEAAYQSRVWREQWEVDTFPPVLAVYREGVVGKGYNEEVTSTGKVQFYGRSLEGFFQDDAIWYDFQKKEKIKLMTW